MKKHIFIILGLILLSATACKDRTRTEVPDGCIEYQGEILKENEPIRYDSNGDGKIDANDKTIGVLGTNLNISQNPDGSRFYSGSSSDSGEDGEGGQGGQGGSGSNETESAVPVGEKLCYHNLEKYCSKNGGLYAYETSVNAAQSSMKNNAFVVADANQNGIADYIEDIRSQAQITALANTVATKYATATEKEIEKNASGRQIGLAYLQECIKTAIVNGLEEALYGSNESIDISNVETIVNTRVSVAIVNAVNESNILQYMDSGTMAKIAEKTANAVSIAVADSIATSVTSAILAQYETLSSQGNITNVQGICPNGYHIPSDVEWMIFEQALGMSASDLTKSGITEINRGADANVVKKMVSDYGFDYGGYASINGTYAQLGEAGVYWSSTTGTDENGDYVWVRQIDTSYNGVIRFKMYEKSGLSVRCFKD